MASVSSGPSISMAIVLPLAAANIMTPMMLLALTLLPLRTSQMLLLNWPASCVNLADARACRPSLLMISASCCSIMKLEHGHPHYAFAATADCLGDYGWQVAVA